MTRNTVRKIFEFGGTQSTQILQIRNSGNRPPKFSAVDVQDAGKGSWGVQGEPGEVLGGCGGGSWGGVGVPLARLGPHDGPKANPAERFGKEKTQNGSKVHKS